MRIGNVRMRYSSPCSDSPLSREKVLLCNGQAIFGTPAASPTIPRERTKAFLCGHMFCVAYHPPREAKLKTAICTCPCLIVAPPSLGKSQTLPTWTQLVVGAGMRDSPN